MVRYSAYLYVHLHHRGVYRVGGLNIPIPTFLNEIFLLFLQHIPFSTRIGAKYPLQTSISPYSLEHYITSIHPSSGHQPNLCNIYSAYECLHEADEADEAGPKLIVK